jgi:ABC-type nitrate/sulfonate/bicarbonate transport system substrate-binding protein
LELDYLAGVQHAGYLVAQAKGFYAKAGLKVRITQGQGSVTTGTLVGTGKADFGIMGAGEILSAVSDGLPLKAVFTQIRQSPTAIVYNPKKVVVTKLSDLYGHKLGIVFTSTVYKEWQSVAENAGIDLSKIDVVNVGANIITAMLSGDVDAIVAYPYSQAVTLALDGLPVKSLMFSAAGEPSIPNSSVVVNTGFASKNPALVKGFVQATKEGWEYTEAHPAEALQILAKDYPQLNPKASAQTLPLVLALMGTPADYGTYNTTAWGNELSLYRKEKLLGSRAITLSSVYDTSYLGS